MFNVILWWTKSSLAFRITGLMSSFAGELLKSKIRIQIGFGYLKRFLNQSCFLWPDPTEFCPHFGTTNMNNNPILLAYCENNFLKIMKPLQNPQSTRSHLTYRYLKWCTKTPRFILNVKCQFQISQKVVIFAFVLFCICLNSCRKCYRSIDGLCNEVKRFSKLDWLYSIQNQTLKW